MQKRRRAWRAGFILLFGSRNLVGNDGAIAAEIACPRCGQTGVLTGKVYRSWFTIFFIPVFPLGGRQKFTECSHCKAQFPMTIDDLQARLGDAEREQSQQAIGLYNSLRSSPANSVTLNELMTMYAGMKEFDQAISAANAFPEALNNSEQCMSTLGRVYLAAGRHAEAVGSFDRALARNGQLGEAHYYKAVTYLTMTPPQADRAVASARAARGTGFPRADELLREAETKVRSG